MWARVAKQFPIAFTIPVDACRSAADDNVVSDNQMVSLQDKNVIALCWYSRQSRPLCFSQKG